MRVVALCLIAVLITVMIGSASALSMPSMLGRPIVPGIQGLSQVTQPSQLPTPAQVAATPAEELFTLTVQGNVYFDKLPVQGAEVSVYLNGKFKGKTVAGDVYIFHVPGVRMGDKVTVEATYEGYTGSASEVVKFKSTFLDVNVKSDHSFIRSALALLPTQDDLNQAQQDKQQAAQQPQETQTAAAAQAPASVTSPASLSNANKLASNVYGNTFKSMGSGFGNVLGAQPSTPTPSGFDGQVSNLNDAMKASGGF